MTLRLVRAFVALATGLSLLAACGDGAAAPRDEPLRIGFLGALSGPFAIYGIPARDGMRLAVQELNDAGGVGGRELELVERDSQGNPDEAVTALRGLVDRDGVIAVGGIISSDVGLATSRVAEAEQVPLFLVKAGSHRILEADSRFTFRTCLPAAPMNIAPLADFVRAEGHERVGAIIADYEWGHAIGEAVEDQIGTLPDVELQVEVAPVPEQDFTTYLRRLERFDPDLLVATGHPPGTGPITRQSVELGVDAPVTGPYNPYAWTMSAVGDAALERFVDFSCADFASADYQELAARYHDAFGDFMEPDAVAGYGTVSILAQALANAAEADGVEIGAVDGPALADAIRAGTFETPGHAWPIRYTDWGELAGARPLLTVIREQPPPEGVHPGAGWYPAVVFRPQPVAPYEPHR